MNRILVAEDDRTTRQWICEILRAEKFSVTPVSDGRAAWKKIQKAKFDLILQDIWMPKMNGLDLLSAMRGKNGHAHVIVITSDDTPGTLLAAIRERAYHYIPKPIERETLVRVVHESLDKKSRMPPIQVVSARPEWVELVVPCTVEAGTRLESFMEHLETGLDDEVRSAVAQAFHELLMNAIEWGGKLNPRRKVRISYLRAKRMLLYRISDPGSGFKFAGLDHAAISHGDEPIAHGPIREQKGLRPGGFGLVLVKAKVDELLYSEAQNEVVFVKYLD